MKTIHLLHRTVLAGLLATTLLGSITLLGMDSNLDSSDEETHELAELETSNRGIWALVGSQVAGARSLVGFGRSLFEDLLLTRHSAQTSHGTKELLTLFLTDKDAYLQLTHCFPKDMKLFLARSLLNGLPLVDFILARLESHCCLKTLQGHDSYVQSAQFNRAGDRIVTTSIDETAKIWDVASGKCLHTLQGHASYVFSAQFSSEGNRIVTASDDCTAKIWDVATGKCLHTFEGHGGYVHSAQFNGAGDIILTASKDNSAKIWDVASGKCLHTLQNDDSTINSAQFNRAEDRILIASQDGTAKIWDIASEVCLHTFQGHDGYVSSAHFNNTEDRIVTASVDGTAKIWDVASGTCLHTLKGHDNVIYSAQFNSAGDKIVTASIDRTAKIWDIASGKCLHTLQGHDGYVNSAHFNGTGDKIVTASLDRTAKIWDVRSLVTCPHWLKSKCSLEQALLLHCIYEARIAEHGLAKLRMKEACPHLQLFSDALPCAVFDFNAFPHLRDCFDAMPPLIQKCLEEFVINK